MDLRQIENIIAIEQEQNISKAAEKLFITQSALNQQLLKLERSLGVPLFERKNHSMIPTYAGKVYLETAHRMVAMKEETYRIIHDISDENSGEISIVYTPERGALMFSEIYPYFHQKYPRIQFRIYEARVKRMEQMLMQRQVTLATITRVGNYRHPYLEYHDMSQELMILGLPASHPLAGMAGKNSWKTLPDFPLGLLKDEYFVLPSKDTRIRDMVNRAFNYAGFQPKILFEASNSNTLVNMVRNQQCPAFFPQSYAAEQDNDRIVYFSVAPRDTWTLGVAYLKGRYLTNPEKYFIELVTRYHQHKPLADF